MAATQYPQFDARSVGRTLWRWAWLIAALTVIAFVVTYGFSKLQPTIYQATAEVSVHTSDPLLVGTGQKASDPVILNNEVYAAKSGQVRAVGNLKLGADAKSVLALKVSSVPLTDVLVITATSNSARVAQAAANAYATAYTLTRTHQLQDTYLTRAKTLAGQAAQYNAQIATLQTQLINDPKNPEAASWKAQVDSLNTLATQASVASTTASVAASTETTTMTVTKLADPPRYPVSPTPLRDAGIAGAVALALGVGLAFLFDQLDNKVKTPDQVMRVTGGVAVLGSVPAYSDGHRHLTHRFHRAERALVAPTSVAAESYHALATSLRFSSLGKEKRTILVTSSVGEEGKTTVTANLAAVLAESGFRVVVVSADLRRPMLGELLHSAETEKGLTSAMLGDRELASCFVSVPLPSGKNIFVLPAGPLPHEPAVLLGSDAFGNVLEQIKRSQADFILVDCAPVLPVSDPVAASRHVDGVIVLALHGETRENDLAETVNRLRQVDANIIGVVLNGMPVSRGRFDYYGYYGYRSYTPDAPVSTNGNGSGPPGAGGPPESPNAGAGAEGSVFGSAAQDVRPMTVKRTGPEPGAASA
jgi:capsular exopolysaccharide synthesis family protein